MLYITICMASVDLQTMLQLEGYWLLSLRYYSRKFEQKFEAEKLFDVADIVRCGHLVLFMGHCYTHGELYGASQ